jgi:hypothetical protein
MMSRALAGSELASIGFSVHTTVPSSLVKSHVTECVVFAERKRLSGRSESRCVLLVAAEEELALADAESESRSCFPPLWIGSGLGFALVAATAADVEALVLGDAEAAADAAEAEEEAAEGEEAGGAIALPLASLAAAAGGACNHAACSGFVSLKTPFSEAKMSQASISTTQRFTAAYFQKQCFSRIVVHDLM